MSEDLPQHDQLDFSTLKEDVKAALESEAASIAEKVFNVVWKRYQDQLEGHLEYLARIPEDRKGQIKSHLVKGFIKGRGRDKDHSWGIDIMAEECRKRIGAALVREIIPPYSNLDPNLPDAETFFQRKVKPFMDAYDVPKGFLGYVSPALVEALKK